MSLAAGARGVLGTGLVLAAGRGASVGAGAAGPAGAGVTRDGFGASAAAGVSGGRAVAGAGFPSGGPGGLRCRLGDGGAGGGRSFEVASLAGAAGDCDWRPAGRWPTRAGWSSRVSGTVSGFAAWSHGPPGGATGWVAAVAPVLVAGVGRADGSRGDRTLASSAGCAVGSAASGTVACADGAFRSTAALDSGSTAGCALGSALGGAFGSTTGFASAATWGFGGAGGCTFARGGGLEAAGLIGGAVAAEVVWGAAGAPDAPVPGRGWPASAAGGCDAEEEVGCPAGAGRPGGRASGGWG
jgi:hypothetical protein